MTSPSGSTPPDTIMGLIRQVRPIYRESSLVAAVDALNEAGSDVVAVLDGSYIRGVLWSSRVSEALLAGSTPDSSISALTDEAAHTILPNATIEEARQRFRETGSRALLAVDGDGRYLGILTPFDLFQRGEASMRPPVVGGMATPYGVFLTNGDVFGGAGPFALAATGGLLFAIFLVGMIVSFLSSARLEGILAEPVLNAIDNYGPLLLFFLLLRLLPLSGTHGAEHKVVHAIERREPLTLEAVGRMPRVHPRCGTNLAIGALIFMTLIGVLWPVLGEVGALIALVLTLASGRPVGSLFQAFITTKNPSRRQLEGAIAAGRELLENYRRSPRTAPAFGRRLMMSGLPWVLLGSFTVAAIAYGLAYVLAGRAPI